MDVTWLWQKFEKLVRRLLGAKTMEEAGVGPRSIRLDMSPSAFDQLRSLQIKTNAESIPVVIKEALGFYHYLIGKVKGEGYSVVLVKGKEVIELKLPFR